MPPGIGGSTGPDAREADMTTSRPSHFGLLLVCVVIGFLTMAFWTGWRFCEARRLSKDYLSQGRFAQLETMLLAYHEAHGTFPPTKYQPEPGGPIHSWRVLLVPHTSRGFIERFSKYDFFQEWNSTNNLEALRRMPYFVYFSMNGDGDIAHYLAIGGEDDWPSKKPLRSRLVKQGNDRFLLVEYSDSGVHWMEPKY
jgi:hypothetical protein